MSDLERTDEALMAAYCGGDQAAFRELFDRYAPRLLRTMRRGLRGEQDAQELVQQTFLQLHRARLDFRPGAQLRPWLYTIAFNLKREYFRKKGRRPEAPLELDGRHDPAVGPHDPLRGERAQQVRTAVAALPAGQREVIELHWFEGLPFAEVAELVGATVTAVKVRAHRGYERMRETLRETTETADDGAPELQTRTDAAKRVPR